MLPSRCHFGMTFMLTGSFILIGCGSPRSSGNGEEGGAEVSCTEPENPHTQGTGHYAGFEWAENNGSGTCSSSSDSFNEGCEEHERQESEYQDCQTRKRR